MTNVTLTLEGRCLDPLCWASLRGMLSKLESPIESGDIVSIPTVTDEENAPVPLQYRAKDDSGPTHS